MPGKFFTVGAATKTLPLVKKIVEEILQHAKAIRNSDGGEEAVRLEDEIKGLLLELEQLGCSFKDWNFEIGLVDFPAIINGQNVLLCWRSDEKNIRWYHGHDEGFTGRKLIPENILEE